MIVKRNKLGLLRCAFFLLLVLGIGTCNLSFGNSYQVRTSHLSTRHGLSSKLVNTIFQDSQGFIWVGTNDGLDRYDAYSIREFRHEPTQNLAMRYNNVKSIAEDDSHRLWIGTHWGGVEVLDLTTLKFISYKELADTVPSLRGKRVRKILFDGCKRLWVLSYEGLEVLEFDEENGRVPKRSFWVKELAHMPLHKGNVVDLMRDSQNRLWISDTYGNVFVADCNFRGRIEALEFRQVIIGKGQKVDNTRSMLEDSRGNIWFSSAKNRVEIISPMDLIGWDGQTPLKPYVFNAPEGVTTLREDFSGFIWMGLETGSVWVYILEENTGGENPEIKNSREVSLPSGASVTSLFSDASGLVWAGTSEAGIYKMELLKHSFGFLNRKELGVNLVDGRRLSAICMDRSRNLWVGTDHGLVGLKLEEEDSLAVKVMYTGLEGEYITALDVDLLGNIWVGTINGVSKLIERSPGLYRQVKYLVQKPEKGEDYANLISDIHCDQQGRIWVTARNRRLLLGQGSVLKDVAGDSLGSLGFFKTPFPHEMTQKIRGRITALKALDDGSLMFGTRTGILYRCRLEGMNKKWRLELYRDFGSYIYQIFQDGKGKVWVGTQYGVIGLHEKQEEDELVRERHGLAHNRVASFAEDFQGLLWMGCGSFITRLDTKELLAQNHNFKDQVRDLHFIAKGGAQDPNGTLFFAASKGIIHFHPGEVRGNTFMPPVLFTGLNVNYKEVDFSNSPDILTKPIHLTDTLVLDYEQNQFTLEFAALNYNDSQNNRYSYRLLGYQNEWVELGTRNSISFTNLDPGSYVVEVHGANNHGVWNRKGAKMTLIVTPAPWRTPWAYIGYLSVLGFIAFLIWRNRSRQRRLKNDLVVEKRVSEAKLRFFTNISHEFRTPLTLILAPLEEMLEEHGIPEVYTKRMEVMQRNAHRLKNLVTQLLDFQKVQAGKMTLNPHHFHFKPLLEEIGQDFNEQARILGLEFHWDIKIENDWVFADKGKIEIILYNLLSNAFKYTQESGSVFLRVHTSVSAKASESGKGEKRMVLAVEDTGRGIEKDLLPHLFERYNRLDKEGQQEGSGVGLALVKEFVDLHDGDVKVESQLGKGTIISVELPVVGGVSVIDNEMGEMVSSQASSIPVDTSDREMGKESELAQSEKHVLIVEDNRELADYLKNHFEPFYKVSTAPNGKVGLEVATTQLPDVVITDVMMPVMDGLEMVRQLKENMQTAYIPIVMLTARGEVEQQVQGYEEGADAYITKPFDLRLLDTRLRNILSREVKRREAFAKAIHQPGPLEQVQDTFIERMLSIIRENLDDADFNVPKLAEELCTSRSSLYRKVKSYTEISINEIIVQERLLEGARLLEQGTLSVSEVAYRVGFRDPKYFSTRFKKQHGQSPSEFVKER